MAKNTDFLEVKRKEIAKRDVKKRVADYDEVYQQPNSDYVDEQVKRCMQCGTPFCNYSCPLGNQCPDWHYFIRNEKWEEALLILEQTNNFPEFTGRLCPALCEGGCVLGINDDPVTNKNVELFLAEKGWEEGWIKPEPPEVRTGKKVAVIGSGPAGLAAAQQLNRLGHWVRVYEKDDQPGGMMRYGIPDFKIDKAVIERRVDQLKAEGVEFIFNTEVGPSYPASKLADEYDAIVLALGSRKARQLPIAGNNLKGIYQAMDFLTAQNEAVAKQEEPKISAKDKKVLVIGGGDTGSDCVGTAVRQGAQAVYQIELLAKPSKERKADNPWPEFPQTLKVSSSHKEAENVLGMESDELRKWSILSKKFSGDDNGYVEKYYAKKINWVKNKAGKFEMEETSQELVLDVDLVILAIGFVGAEENRLFAELNIEQDAGQLIIDDYQTTNPQVFATGDVSRGPSLIVWAISDGRKSAKKVNKYLKK